MYCKSMEQFEIVNGCRNKGAIIFLENLPGKLCNGLLLEDTKG